MPRYQDKPSLSPSPCRAANATGAPAGGAVFSLPVLRPLPPLAKWRGCDFHETRFEQLRYSMAQASADGRWLDLAALDHCVKTELKMCAPCTRAFNAWAKSEGLAPLSVAANKVPRTRRNK